MKYYYAERRVNRSGFCKEYGASPVPLKKIQVLQNQEIAAQRKCIVEHPFGAIKRDMGIAYLLLSEAWCKILCKRNSTKSRMAQ